MRKKVSLSEINSSIVFIIDHMATKEDVSGIMSELSEIKRRIKDVERLTEDHSGHSKEIDHALTRIRVIEKRLGIKSGVA